MNPLYLDTARLLIQTAPLVFVDDTFALKGGTAINLFLREMPRLSVDLDLVIRDHTLTRQHALAKTRTLLQQASERLTKRGLETSIRGTSESESKLFVRRGKLEVKVEVNLVMRGTVHPVRRLSLTRAAQEALLGDVEVPVVSLEDLYGGKLVAAMDRQHPRDLFDVAQLFSHEGITEGIRRAFVVYLAGHNRPVHEVLFPVLRDIRQDYENNFDGMTEQRAPLEDLLAVRERMILEVQNGLDAKERQFLLSLVEGTPEWQLLEIPHLERLPGLRWKLENLRQLRKTNAKKFREQAEVLAARFARMKH